MDINFLITKLDEFMSLKQQEFNRDVAAFAAHRFEHLQAQAVDYLIKLEEELRQSDEDDET